MIRSRPPIIGLPDYTNLNRNTLPEFNTQRNPIKGTISEVTSVDGKIYARVKVDAPTTDLPIVGQSNNFGGMYQLDETDKQYYKSAEQLDSIYTVMALQQNDTSLDVSMFEE